MNKKLYCLVIAIGLGVIASHAQKVTRLPRIYRYHVDPKSYPDYKRRMFKTPDWTTFNDTVQFVGGRSWAFGDTTMEIPPNWIPGAKVFRPNFSNFFMSKDSVEKSLLYLRESGKYLFNINAYGPGTPVTGSFGQFVVEDWKRNLMQNILEDRYMGFDLGEQDGRYWADARSVDYPMTSNYKERYLRQINYMQKAARDQGGIISMLSVKGFWHYPMKDGYVTISGAESQHKTHTSNNQVHYAFIRGGSKQYGLLWYGDISVFNTWGYKRYSDKEATNSGPEKGNSLAWMKRMLFTQYQYNSAILGFESSKYFEDEKETVVLSPIGQLQMDAQQFVQQYPKPGPQYTPVALLQDFFSGWMTPSVPSRQLYKVWNYLPYQDDDYVLHKVFDQVFPGYGEAGVNKNEYGSLSATPYGDIFDALLTDVSLPLLKQYNVVVLTSTIKSDTLELADKLLPFVKGGGQLVLSDKDAVALFPQHVTGNSGTNFLVKNIEIGDGLLPVVYNGLNEKQDLNVLRAEYSSYLDSLFRSQRLFSVGNDSLAYITNLENDSTFLIGIYNNTLHPQHFKIRSHVGDIGSCEELILTRSFETAPGYFPEGFKPQAADTNSSDLLSGGAVRLFKVSVRSPALTQLPQSVFPDLVRDSYIEVSSLIGLAQTLKTIPGFFDVLSGIKINLSVLDNVDELAWEEDNWWYNLKRVQWMIEFSESDSKRFSKDGRLDSALLHKLTIINEPLVFVVADKFEQKMQKLLKQAFHSCNIVKKSDYERRIRSAVRYNGNLKNWSEVYARLPKSRKRSEPIVYAVDVIKRISTLKKMQQQSGNQSYVFAFHGIDVDLASFIMSNINALREFGGVKVDGAYLVHRSEQKCKEEGALLRQLGYTVMVDLSRELNNYPDLTWLSELGVSYQRSSIILEKLLRKMSLIGAGEVIISSHMRPEMWKFEHRTAEQSIEAGMAQFVELASVFNINVHIKNMSNRFYPGRLLAKPDEVSQLVERLAKRFKNVKVAASWGVEPQPSKFTTLFNAADLQIVAASGSDLFDYQVPANSILNNIPIVPNSSTVFIFDADYKDLSELLEDKVWLEVNRKN